MPNALEKLTAYDWPGNVRELANVIERAVVLGNGPVLTIEDLPGRIAATEVQRISDDLSYRRSHGSDASRARLEGVDPIPRQSRCGGESVWSS